MKHLTQFAFIFLMLIAVSCHETVPVDKLKQFAATERYPDDNFLDTVSNKRALIVVAHDDDDCAMAGTIARLTAGGWTIEQLSLTRHPLAGTDKNPSDIICNGNRLILEDGIYRPGLDTMKSPYMPIPYAKIREQFLTEKVAEALVREINAFGPSVLFTLDNVKGGYGHPEHIFISQLVKDLFEENKTGAQRIYQSVYTSHMEHEIVDVWLDARLKKWGYPNASKTADRMYGVSGMPQPDVQVGIAAFAETKMNYLMAYDEDVRKNLRKFIPYFEQFDAKTYFGIFDREFFRIIEKPAG